MKNKDWKKSWRGELLGQWGAWAAKNWGKTLLIVLGISVLAGFGLTQLKLEMTFYNILPNSSSQVEDMKAIVEKFPYASSIIAVVDARSVEDPQKAEEMAKSMVDQATVLLQEPKFEEFVLRASGSLDREFFLNHGLVFSEVEDIQRLGRIHSAEDLAGFLGALNDDFEREYTSDQENLSDNESEALSRFRGLEKVLTQLETTLGGRAMDEESLDEALDDYLLGDGYFMSRNRKMALIFIQPTFTINDIFTLYAGVNAVEEALDSIETEEVSIGLTGMTTIMRDEIVTSEEGLVLSSFLAFLAILAVLILVFRMFSVPLIAGIPLVVGILWAAGMTGLALGRLNIVSAMYMVALLGLGIDFAIHILSAFIQKKDAGLEFSAAITQAMKEVGPGLLTGALTTVVAFFALVFGKTELIQELGVVAGLGILAELLAMVLLLPALLGLRESLTQRRGKQEHKMFQRISIRSDLASGLGRFLVKRPLWVTLGLGALFLAGLYFAPGVGVETNLMNMEAKGLESVHLQDEMVLEFGTAPDGLSIITSDPLEMQRITKALEELSSVKAVASLGDFYLGAADHQERVPLLENLRERLAQMTSSNRVDQGTLIQEIERLEMNFFEMADLAFLGGMDDLTHGLGVILGLDEAGVKVSESVFDRLYQQLDSGDWEPEVLVQIQKRVLEQLREKVISMANPDFVMVDDLPVLLRSSFVSADGADFLITVEPTQNPWDGEYREVYAGQIATVTDRATGMVLAGDQLTTMAEEDGLRAAVLALGAIFLILLLDFRNLKLVLLTILPLLMSFAVLFGVMALLGIKFDFINVIVIPLMIGIGVDDAVHVSHRYLLEGRGKMQKVIATTGTALLLTTLTTVFGFASFIPSRMEGMKSTGIVLSLAMAICFIYSVFFHPALLKLIREKLGGNFLPLGF